MRSPKTNPAGKGDRPRNNFSQEFRENYDSINWKRPLTAQEAVRSIVKRFGRGLAVLAD